jgi:hypothetical protein
MLQCPNVTQAPYIGLARKKRSRGTFTRADGAMLEKRTTRIASASPYKAFLENGARRVSMTVHSVNTLQAGARRPAGGLVSTASHSRSSWSRPSS